MRSKVGDKIELVINKKAAIYEITSFSPFNARKINDIDLNPELKNEVTLFYCLSKGDKIDFAIQKATELGVSRIILCNSKYSVVRYDSKDIVRKMKRFKEIAKSAAEQSHRLIIPEVIGVYDIADIKDYMGEHNFLAYEKESENHANPTYLYEKIKENEKISIFIGSEGGFSEEEVLILNKLGFINISLGKRILRTETAVVCALSQLNLIIEK